MSKIIGVTVGTPISAGRIKEKMGITAGDVKFTDGDTFQQKYDSGELRGSDGTSPTVGVSNITGGYRLTITDKNGTKTVNVMNGKDGSGGGEGGGAFIATYGVTTFAEITTAVAEGKVVFMDYGPPVETYRYQLQTYSAMYGICIFTSVHSSGRIFVAMVESNGKWSNYTVDVGGGGSGEGGGETEIFYAAYGATTYDEVYAAAAAGKLVMTEYWEDSVNRRIYYLNESRAGDEVLRFVSHENATATCLLELTPKGWNKSEKKINAVTFVNGAAADENGNVTLNFEVEKQEIVNAVLANFIDVSEVGM
jgi:hypothetical protein